MATEPNRSILEDFFESDDDAPKGKNYLFAVGIDAYQHVGKLSNAVRDAKTFVALMKDKYQFDTENILELYDEKASKREIISGFRLLINTIKNKEDNLIVYFSGHGKYDKILEEGYWVPVEAKFQAEVDFISYSYIKKVVNAIETKHTIMIVDSCYSGSVLMGSRDLNEDRFETDPSRWLLASGRNEVVPDGVIGGHSPFAESLLSILRRYADKGIRMGTLVDKITTAVTYNSTQTPIGRPIFGVGDEGGEFFFRPKKNEKESWLAAKQTHTPEAYKSFLDKYREGKYAEIALAQIKMFAEDDYWAQIRAYHTAEKYSEYMREYPGGKYRGEALKFKKMIQADKALEQVEVETRAVNEPTETHKPLAVVNTDMTKDHIASPSVSRVSKKHLMYIALAATFILAGVLGVRLYNKGIAEREKQAAIQSAIEESDMFLEEGKLDLAGNRISELQEMYPSNEQLENKQQSLRSKRVAWTDSLEENGDKFMKEGKYLEAIGKYEEAIRLIPGQKLEIKLDDAEMQYENMVKKQSLETQIYKSDSLFIAGDYKHAHEGYANILKTTPDDSLAKHRKRITEKAIPLPEVVFVEEVNAPGFYIGKYEITNEEYCAFLNDVGNHRDSKTNWISLNRKYSRISKSGDTYTFRTADAKLPVTGVNWFGAKAYCEWVGGQLPTVSQWEYAARGGVKKENFKYSGSNTFSKVAGNFNTPKTTWPQKVGYKAPNSLQIYNMTSNVWEWCQSPSDVASPDFQQLRSQKREIKGGSFNRKLSHMEIGESKSHAVISFNGPRGYENDMGFRIIRMKK